MFKVLAEMGELEATADASRLPAPDELDPESCYLAWDLVLVSAAPRAEIEEVFAWAGDESRVTIRADQARRGRAPPEPPSPSAAVATAARSTGEQLPGATKTTSARRCAPTGCT